MNTQDTKPRDPRRVEEPRPGAQDPKVDAARAPRPPAHLVDPYDMRAEPQQEEPGYGHGV